MANALYKAGRTAFATGNIKWRSTGGDTISCMLTTRLYSPDLKNDTTVSNIPVTARIGKDGNTDIDSMPRLSLISPEDGICDANDVDFGIIPNGNEIKGLVIFKDMPTEKASTLIAYIDVDFISNGTQVVVSFDNGPDKIFRL